MKRGRSCYAGPVSNDTYWTHYFFSITDISVHEDLYHSGWLTIDAEYQVGDVVEIVIDDEDDPDSQCHGMEGEVIEVGSDDLGGLTGDPSDDFMYAVELENGEVPGVHFRERDLERVDAE